MGAAWEERKQVNPMSLTDPCCFTWRKHRSPLLPRCDLTCGSCWVRREFIFPTSVEGFLFFFWWGEGWKTTSDKILALSDKRDATDTQETADGLLAWEVLGGRVGMEMGRVPDKGMGRPAFRSPGKEAQSVEGEGGGGRGSQVSCRMWGHRRGRGWALWELVALAH